MIWCQPMFFIPDSKKFLHWITDISKSQDIHIIVNEIIMCIRSHHYLLKDHSVLIPTLSKMIGTFQQVRSGVVFSGDHFRGISADKHRTCQHQQVTMFLVLCQDIVLGIAQGKLLHADNNANFILARWWGANAASLVPVYLRCDNYTLLQFSLYTPMCPVPMHAKVTKNITGGILERLHVVCAWPVGFYVIDFSYLKTFSIFYSF